MCGNGNGTWPYDKQATAARFKQTPGVAVHNRTNTLILDENLKHINVDVGFDFGLSACTPVTNIVFIRFAWSIQPPTRQRVIATDYLVNPSVTLPKLCSALRRLFVQNSNWPWSTFFSRTLWHRSVMWEYVHSTDIWTNFAAFPLARMSRVMTHLVNRILRTNQDILEMALSALFCNVWSFFHLVM